MVQVRFFRSMEIASTGQVCSHFPQKRQLSISFLTCHGLFDSAAGSSFTVGGATGLGGSAFFGVGRVGLVGALPCKVSCTALFSPSCQSSAKVRHFLGQPSTHWPQVTHLSRSMVQVRFFRSMEMASTGQVCSHFPQKRHWSMSFLTCHGLVDSGTLEIVWSATLTGVSTGAAGFTGSAFGGSTAFGGAGRTLGRRVSTLP